MKWLSEEKVKKELEDLLINLDINHADKESKKEFLKFINIYWNSYDLKEYQEKANKILERYR